jgi:TolB-like protein/DNA-binding winged helix-turn-helix (wHTH) protein/Flp pilus assembly protein TadD
MLIEHPNELVTREELRRRLWRDETFVDFDHGLNSIVNRLRETLRDSAEHPVFIETLPRRGYRFLAPVEVIAPEPAHGAPELPPVAESPAPPAAAGPSADEPRQQRQRRNVTRTIAIVCFVALPVAAGIGYLFRELAVPPSNARTAGAPRLAVLPFDNLTRGDEQEFFADGLHEEMIFRLGRMQPQRLAVIARSSVMPYRNASKSIATIARELNVDYVLEGSVRRAGDRFRITAQLIRADNQLQLWTETYDRTWKDVFAIQTDVGARVADSLAIELLPSYQAAVERDRNTSPKAYEHYLRGRFYWNQRTRDMAVQLGRAIEQFNLAIAEQPDYALAYAGIADAYDSIAFSDPSSGQPAVASARAAIQRALQLDARLASAHATLAWMTMHFDRDLSAAQRAFERALELDPSDSLARFRYSHLLAIRGRVREAESAAQMAREADPRSAPIANILAWYAYYTGAYSQALQRMREAAELGGEPARFHAFAAYLSAVQGDCVRAQSELAGAPLAADTLTTEVAFVLARCGDAQRTEDLRRLLIARRLAFPLAMLHYGRDERDMFYDCLNRAIDDRSPEPLYIGVDPVFSRERQDPRLQAALGRLGL